MATTSIHQLGKHHWLERMAYWSLSEGTIGDLSVRFCDNVVWPEPALSNEQIWLWTPFVMSLLSCRQTNDIGHTNKVITSRTVQKFRYVLLGHLMKLESVPIKAGENEEVGNDSDQSIGVRWALSPLLVKCIFGVTQDKQTLYVRKRIRHRCQVTVSTAQQISPNN
jgi:hypothetical protein